MTDRKEEIILVGGRMVGRMHLVQQLAKSLSRDVVVMDDDSARKQMADKCLDIPEPLEVSSHPERRKPKNPKRRRLKRKPGGKL